MNREEVEQEWFDTVTIEDWLANGGTYYEDGERLLASQRQHVRTSNKQELQEEIEKAKKNKEASVHQAQVDGRI